MSAHSVLSVNTGSSRGDCPIALNKGWSSIYCVGTTPASPAASCPTNCRPPIGPLRPAPRRPPGLSRSTTALGAAVAHCKSTSADERGCLRAASCHASIGPQAATRPPGVASIHQTCSTQGHEPSGTARRSTHQQLSRTCARKCAVAVHLPGGWVAEVVSRQNARGVAACSGQALRLLRLGCLPPLTHTVAAPCLGSSASLQASLRDDRSPEYTSSVPRLHYSEEGKTGACLTSDLSSGVFILQLVDERRILAACVSR